VSPESLRVVAWLMNALLAAVVLGALWLVARALRHRRLTGVERAERRRKTWLIATGWLAAVVIFLVASAAIMIHTFRTATACLDRARAGGPTDSREMADRCATDRAGSK